MKFLNIFASLAFHTVILTINFNLCDSSTFPLNVNQTVETTALAKTSTAIVDAFEDIRWFFGRLGNFCDLVEKMLPTEKRNRNQTQLTMNLQSGLRHFLLGVREISKSVVAVLSNKEVQEYQQLSRATDYVQDIIKSVGEFFRNFRLLVGNLFETYNYYVPEVMLTKCVGKYLHETYSHRPFYEYPVLFINDIIGFIKTPTNWQFDINALKSDRKIGSGSERQFEKDFEQNEILDDDDMYVFHNTVVSPTPELAARFGFGNTTPESIDLAEDKENLNASMLSWKKCFKMYATEKIFRKLEFYFLERK